MTVKQKLARKIDWMRKQAQVDQPQGQQPGQNSADGNVAKQTSGAKPEGFAAGAARVKRELDAFNEMFERKQAEYWKKHDINFYNSMYGHKYGKIPSEQPQKLDLFRQQLPRHGSPLDNAVLNSGRDVLGAFNAGVGAVYGNVSEWLDGYKRHGWRAWVPGTDAFSDTWKRSLKAVPEYAREGWRLGHRAGELESVPERVMAQMAQAAQGIPDSVGLMPQGVKNALKIDQWNDKLTLQAMQRAGVKVPETLPTDENGKLVPTGDPRYADYDNFVNWSGYGSGAAEFALSIPVFGGVVNKTVGLAGKGARMAHLGPKMTKVLTSAAGNGARAYMGYQFYAKPMGRAAIDGYREGVLMAEQERHHRELDEFDRAFQRLFQYEPGSPEYDQYYDQLMSVAEMIPGADEIVNYYLE